MSCYALDQDGYRCRRKRIGNNNVFCRVHQNLAGDNDYRLDELQKFEKEDFVVETKLKAKVARTLEKAQEGGLSAFQTPKYEIKKTKTMGYGVFATKNYKPGDTIEISRSLIIPCSEIRQTDTLMDYVFMYDKDHFMLPYGNIAMCNHSDNPNAIYHLTENHMILQAKKPIKKGDEIFISYGKNWWDIRNHKKKI